MGYVVRPLQGRQGYNRIRLSAGKASQDYAATHVIRLTVKVEGRQDPTMPPGSA
jgi:hypothetical protein